MSELVKIIKNKIEDKKVEKEIKLLDSAYKLYLTKGINNTSIQDIVNDAGVAKGTGGAGRAATAGGCAAGFGSGFFAPVSQPKNPFDCGFCRIDALAYVLAIVSTFPYRTFSRYGSPTTSRFAFVSGSTATRVFSSSIFRTLGIAKSMPHCLRPRCFFLCHLFGAP